VPTSRNLRLVESGVETRNRGLIFCPREIDFFIDFDGLHERECGSGDLEEWTARLNEKGEPDCLIWR
jgi:hypothetical protein